MPVLKSSLDVSGSKFAANKAAMETLLAELQEKTANAAIGGPEASRKRHVERGKLLPRERVERLLDPGSAFLEIGALAANGMYDNEAPGAGLITGVGRVEGRECLIVCNDATAVSYTHLTLPTKRIV